MFKSNFDKLRRAKGLAENRDLPVRIVALETKLARNTIEKMRGDEIEGNVLLSSYGVLCNYFGLKSLCELIEYVPNDSVSLAPVEQPETVAVPEERRLPGRPRTKEVVRETGKFLWVACPGCKVTSIVVATKKYKRQCEMQRVHVDKATGNVHQLISCEDTIGIGLTSLPCRTCKTMIPLPTPDQIEAEGQVTFTAPSTPTPVDSAFRPARIRKNCPNCESPINMYLTVEDWRADVSQQDVPFGTWEENPEGDVMCAECGSWIDLPPKEAFPGSEPEKTLPALPRDQKPISINPLDLDIPEEIVCPHPGCKQVIHVYSKKERADAQRPRLEQIQVIAYEESGEETLCQSCGQKIPILDPNREEDFEE